jgi:hypothetical protein
MKNQWIKRTASLLVISCTSLSLPMPVSAAVIPTDAIITNATTIDITRQRSELTNFLARGDVKTQLVSWGVSPDQAAARIAALSDDEVQQLHGKMPAIPAGGDIIGVLVFIFLVLLVTDILGLTKVFPFTRHI